MTSPQKSVVRAAGCVLWRHAPSGNDLDAGTGNLETNLEIGLVHRPKYDDWSHPKGKLKRGEDALAGAVREVTEETGMDCRPGAPLPTSYYLAGGRPKRVRYWAAEAVTGSFTPSAEVDRLIWLPPAEARARLTYERDRPLVDALLATLHLA
ncbi:NUDIX hydrolase [Streptomyces sp. NPDC001339]|uniref:NUDIX hydrolase n=1 Tax=Streptomyces sp. NPDC001339 TaxID=3364563 RepID=UPI00368EE992